jgi:hypothetical protein
MPWQPLTSAELSYIREHFRKVPLPPVRSILTGPGVRKVRLSHRWGWRDDVRLFLGLPCALALPLIWMFHKLHNLR